MLILQKFFQKVEGKGILQLSLQGKHYPDTKPDKVTTKTENYRKYRKENNPDEHRCKNPQQNTSRLNSAAYRKDQTPWSVGFILKSQG